MNIKLPDILLKSIPYMLSILGGVALFLVTVDTIKNPSIADLMNNISASLLSIPIVFLLYDYSNYRISKKLNQTLASNMSSRVMSLMLGIVLLLRKSIGARGQLTLGGLTKMRDMRPGAVASRLKITKAQRDQLHAYHATLDDMIYKYGKNGILDTGSMQLLSALALELLHLINESEFRGNRRQMAKNFVNIVGHIADWMDSDASSALNFQKLLQSAADGDISQNN